MSIKLGDRIERRHRLQRVLGRTPKSFVENEAVTYSRSGTQLTGDGPVQVHYGRSHPLHRQSGHRDGPFTGWACYQGPGITVAGSSVSWWLEPVKVSGIIVATTWCQWGYVEWNDYPYFSQAGSFKALYVATDLGPVSQLTLVPAEL